MILERRFTRDAVSGMSAEAFMSMHANCMGSVTWDESDDTLVFIFHENAWCFLMLKHPELIDQYSRL